MCLMAVFLLGGCELIPIFRASDLFSSLIAHPQNLFFDLMFFKVLHPRMSLDFVQFQKVGFMN